MHGDAFLHRSCRGCRGRLEEILNLGDLRLNAFPGAPWQIPTIPKVPLILTACVDCGLVQLDRTVPPDTLYRQYWYRSQVNETMVAELADVVDVARAWRPVGDRDLVVDIGANDGTLLHQYALGGSGAGLPYRVGVEPAYNLQTPLASHCEAQHSTYFPDAAYDRYRGRARIVTAIAMAYDLEDPVAFFQAAADLLTPDGILVVQFQDLLQQMESAAFDNICHEHLEYYTLWSLTQITRRVGLYPVDVQQRAINGGSLRVIFARSATASSLAGRVSVGAQFGREIEAGLDTLTLRTHRWQAFDRFRTRVQTAIRQVRAALQPAFDQQLVVDVCGASTKGNITLQVLGLGPDKIRQVLDRSDAKWGAHTITGIPIVSERVAQQDPADLWLLNIWQFKESVLRRERWYLQQGGTILVPLPQVEVVRETWGMLLEGGA